MTLEIGLVFAILALAITLFITELVRVDLVALMVLVALALTGLLEPAKAISGFSNPAVITVWAVFILSGGLSRTGIAGLLGRQVLRVAGNSEARLVVVIMLTAAVLSAFMNNVGVAALLLPVVMDIARQTRRPPSKLLIPLASASLMGGLMTQIGTPPNILVTAALEDNGLEPFSMFDFTPVGAIVVLAGITYMALIGRRLLPSHQARPDTGGERVDLDGVYNLTRGLFALDVPEDSPLAGRSLAGSRLGSALGLNVMGIRRDGEVDLAPDPSTRYRVGDCIIVQGPRAALAEVGARRYLDLLTETVSPEELVSDEVGFAEVTLASKSRLVGADLRGIGFRSRFNVLILAAWRDGEPLRTHLATAQLEASDVLLVHGTHADLSRLADNADFDVRPVADLGKYGLEQRLMWVQVPADSPAAGKSLAESRLGDVFSLGVMAIERGGRKRLIPPASERLEAGDRLIVKGKKEDLLTAEGLHELPVSGARTPELSELESERVALAEVVVAPRSAAAGKTLAQLHFREKYGFNVMAVMREGEVHRNLRYFQLKFGDALLLHGPREKLRLLGGDDFVVLTQDAQEPQLDHKAPVAALIMGVVIATVLLGLAPIYIAGVAGAVMMVLTGCLTMDGAYRAIEWRAVFLIGGMLPLGLAMTETGAAELVTRGVVGVVGGMGPLAVVAGLYLLTAVSAQVMPTSAVAILVAPLAVNMAAELGMSPYALMMTVSLAASASFMSPVAHPANVLIMGPGRYRFIDYIKVGLPLTLICLAVVLLVLPRVWPLVP